MAARGVVSPGRSLKRPLLNGEIASAAAAAATATTATEAEPLRDALNIPGEQQFPERLELIGVAAAFVTNQHDVDARHEPRAVALL